MLDNKIKKHALVIGGTRGLGRVVVKTLSEEGHKVSVVARNKPKDNAIDNKNVVYVEADLMKPDSFLKTISGIIENQGKINYLIFLQRYRGDYWAEELGITLNATSKIIDHLKNEFSIEKNFDASIVMVSSIAGCFATESQPMSYSVAKAGLNQMARHYAAQLGSYGIRVNTVSSFSFIKDESTHFYEENKELQSLYQKIVPLKRMCRAEDIANAISFLCNPKSSFISGQNIIVDGGLSVLNHEILARTISGV